MCKHILINDFQLNDIETLKHFTSLTYDDDGFGAIIRYRDDKIDTLKSLDLASFYIELTKQLLTAPIKTLVVHHRTSTNEKGLDYAHPFEFQGNYLTHNGVVRVPGTHNTQTKNDSESLLHHLIKTGFETHTIEGYFSCFILNQNETFVLVDDTAPMFSNGRIYSSHKLGESWEKISLKKLKLCPDIGKVIESESIVVPMSNYGNDQKIYSLGTYNIINDFVDWGYPYPQREEQEEKEEEFYPRITDNIRFFFDCLNAEEEESLESIRDDRDLREAIEEIAASMGLKFSRSEMSEVIAILYQGDIKNASNW